MRVAVVGGGAAGFFAAISAKQHHSQAEVFLYEKSNKVLSKVKVSGGGRCNVTHHCFDIKDLSKNYPRGERFLKKAFYQFAVQDTIDWFELRGVELKTESDNRMFPTTDDSQTIIKLLTMEFNRAGCTLKTQCRVEKLTSESSKVQLVINGKKEGFDKVILATGGSPKLQGLQWLVDTGHGIENPVPSLYTFNIPNENITTLSGAVAANARVRIMGEKLENTGPLLITHWGFSGPGVLKLSAFGARVLAEKNYQFSVAVSWVANANEEGLRKAISNQKEKFGKQQLSTFRLEGLPKKIWWYLLDKLELPHDKRWLDLSKKEINKLVNVLLNDEYKVSGKTTFKEEFVTCGGVSLSDVKVQTMESKVVPNLYFAGELLDIDGVTGGFNFQAAWTTGFIAGKLA